MQGAANQNHVQQKTYTCRICKAVLPSRSLLHVHRVRAHSNQIGGADLQARPWNDNDNPFDEFPNSEDFDEIYNDNDIYILSPHHFVTPLKFIYNFPINKRVDNNDIRNIVESVVQHPNQGKAFKFNLSAGVIMENRENGNLRYFKPAINAALLPELILVKDRRTMERAIIKLQEMDLDELIRNYRLNTKWIVKFVTNIEVNVYNTLFPLGNDNAQLPDYVKRNRCIRTYSEYLSVDDRKNLCMFIALAYHKKHKYVKSRAVALMYRWKEFIEGVKGEEVEDASTVEFSDLPEFEECFKIKVNVYELQPDATALSRYKSRANFEDEMNLNVYNNHVNLITNIEKFCNGYVCAYCNRLFRYPSRLRTHQSTCASKTRYLFRAGFCEFPCTVFDRLEEVGINVPRAQRFFPYFVCFDFEAILVRENKACTQRTKFTHRHVPVSCSIASNVPGHTSPVCVIDESPDELIRKLFDVLDEIRTHSLPLIHAKWGTYVDKLKSQISDREYNIRAQLSEEAWKEIGGDDGKLEKIYKADKIYKDLQILETEFLRYINQTIVIGFNNSRYDQQLIKRPLVKFLIENERIESTHRCARCHETPKWKHDCPLSKFYKAPAERECYTQSDYFHPEMGKVGVIKRGNAYVSMTNNFYHFLDISQFLPPATSYDKFLTAYGIENGKQYFCYEWLDSFEKLNEQLPPYPSDAWFSTLKDKDILADEYEQYLANGEKGKRPLTGEEKYRKIQELWQEQGWSSMKDLLIYYNNADVGPFVNAAAIMMGEYFAQGIDVFKIAVSIPGISKYKMMQYAKKNETIFPMFPEKDKDLYFMFKSQLCAGASLIITRFAEKNVTPIRPHSDKMVQSCIGLDANALYCAQLGLEMPSFAYVRRRSENHFKPEFNQNYYMAQVWLKSLSESTGLNFRSLRSMGREVRVGKYFLDGYAVTKENEKVAAEFNGCYYHQHINCELHTNCVSIDKYIKTLEKAEFLQRHGFRVITMWECEFRRMMSKDVKLQLELSKYKPKFYKANPKCVTQEQILHAIANGDIFGYALVDIHVPRPLRHFFDAFPPIFANHTVEKEDLSPHMKKHVEEQGIPFNKGRRLLLTGMEAEEILLSTKMIEWCLKHGLRVNKVYQVVEFVAARPFKKFVEDVAERRLQGARDPNKKIIAEIYKLMG